MRGDSCDWRRYTRRCIVLWGKPTASLQSNVRSSSAKTFGRYRHEVSWRYRNSQDRFEMNMRTHCLSDTLSLLGLNEKAWDGKEGVGEEMLCMDGWPLRSGGDGALMATLRNSLRRRSNDTMDHCCMNYHDHSWRRGIHSVFSGIRLLLHLHTLEPRSSTRLRTQRLPRKK